MPKYNGRMSVDRDVAIDENWEVITTIAEPLRREEKLMTKEQKHYNLGFDAGLEVSLIKMLEILKRLESRNSNSENLSILIEVVDEIDDQLLELRKRVGDK